MIENNTSNEQSNTDEKKSQKTKPTKLEKYFKWLRFWEKVLFRVLFPYKKYGHTEKINEGPLIIVGNHYSVLDVIYPCMITDRPVHFMAKKELWEGSGMMKKFVTKCECIPVNRDGNDVQAVKTALRYLKNDGVVNIFPEGTRNHSYEDFLPFKGGAAALAIKTKTPILPIVQVKKLKLFRKSHIIYGEPIELSKYYGMRLTSEQLDKIDNELRDTMKNMRQSFIEQHNIKFKKMTTK